MGCRTFGKPGNIPSDLLKLATHSKPKVIPASAPLPIGVAEERSPDEAASDPLTEVENEFDEVPRDDVPTEVEETAASVAPNAAAVSPTDDSMIDAAVDKRPMEENTGEPTTKVAKVQSQSVKHSSDQKDSEERSKMPRRLLVLRSAPYTFIFNFLKSRIPFSYEFLNPQDMSI